VKGCYPFGQTCRFSLHFHLERGPEPSSAPLQSTNPATLTKS
jgi:hypothetical protein